MTALIALLLFISGATSLIFESVWTRGLSLAFGSTTLAIATIFAAFMGGIGLGSFVISRIAHRARNALRYYALAELAIGAYALAVPSLLRGYPRLGRLLVDLLGERAWALWCGELVASLLVLAAPTVLMGFTLPLVVRAMAKVWRERGLASSIGKLYAANTFGALIGAAAAGFLLLPSLGQAHTNHLAALGDLGVGVVALLLARRLPATAAADAAPSAAPRARAQKIALAAFVGSGATAMALEVLWSRALGIVLGSSVYAFTLILIVFLGGLAAGARLFAGVAARTRSPARLLAALHVATGAAVLLTHTLIDRLPLMFLDLAKVAASPRSLLTADLVASLAVMLLPTVLMGGVFPLTIRLCVRTTCAASDLGVAYAVNSLGAVVGSAAAGFLVLPRLGLERGMIGAGAIDVALGVLILSTIAEGARSRRASLVWPATAAYGLALLLAPHWNLSRLQSGLFRTADARRAAADPQTFRSRKPPVFYRDGISSSISVEEADGQYGLRNNGKPDASTQGDMETQILLGLLPALFAPSATPDVAVIGYGSGVTVGSVTQGGARHIDAIELEPAVIEASRFFDGVNQRPLADPRVALHLTDGRNWLARGHARYDIIISEPPNPWVAGVASLFTREFWDLAHERLRDDGVFCQWLQAYELSPASFRILVRTFSGSFRYTYVFANSGAYDMFLIGSDQPLRFDRRWLERRLSDGTLRAESARAHVRNASDLVARLLLGPRDIEPFTAGAPVNTDDNSLIEFSAPYEMLAHANDAIAALLKSETWPFGQTELLLADGDAPDEALVSSYLALGRTGRANTLAQTLRLVGDPHAAALAALINAADPLPPRPNDLQSEDTDALEATFAADYLSSQGELIKARNVLGDLLPLVRIDDGKPRLYRRDLDVALSFGMAALHAKLPNAAMLVLQGVEDDAAACSRRPLVLLVLGRAYFESGLRAQGVGLLERYLVASRG